MKRNGHKDSLFGNSASAAIFSDLRMINGIVKYIDSTILQYPVRFLFE